jgi:hypothetical protein
MFKEIEKLVTLERSGSIHKAPREVLEKIKRYFPDGIPSETAPKLPFIDILTMMADEFSAKSLISEQICFSKPWSIEFPGLFCDFCIVQQGSCYARFVDSYDTVCLHSHQMTINGKRDHFTMDDFLESGKSALLKRGQAKNILDETREVVSRWRDYADQVGVNPDQRDKIQKTLRLKPFD